MKKVIEVNNLSKKYKFTTGEPYSTLRDSIAGIGSKIGKRIRKKRQNEDGLYVDEFWALKDVSFSLKEGEILGIIGKNGAGKSTLLKLISRITPPTTGSIKIDGRTASLLEVGTGFHPELTGRENIYLNGAILGMKRREVNAKFDEIVAFSEIEKFLDMPVKRYSSGMYTRLAFAVAANLQPEILIVDEVLAVGDSFFQKKCMGKIKSVSGEGKSILLVSHNMGSVRQISDRCILINSGRIEYIGNPSKCVDRYLNQNNEDNFSPKKNYPPNNKEAQILSLELYDKRDKHCNVFKLGESAYGILTYIMRKPLKKVNVSLSLRFEDSVIWTANETEICSELLEGRIKGVFIKKIPIPTELLQPGQYMIGPSMGYVGLGPIDRQYHNGIYFDVENITKDNKTLRYYQLNGNIYYLKKWEKV